jgi:formate hydrogenlyase subunit 4
MPSLVGFQGDLLLFAYLLALMRFFTVIAALDTGSSFEGMGASREVTFSMLAEPALLLGLVAMARFVSAGSGAAALSLSGIYGPLSMNMLVSSGGPAMLLVAAALGVVFLAENSRIPVDDPNTHLELTMIHEAMVLDHGGVDFAFIQYGAALKLWLLGSLMVGIAFPVRSGMAAVDLAAGVGGMIVLAVVVGVIESTMARLRLLRVPQLLVAATVLSVLAMILVMR